MDSEAAPKWMVDLEEKLTRLKERKQLGHEFGAGSPCNTCKDKCPGLDLHFWRKTCIACKCKKEDHDIPADERDVRFEILFNKEGSKPKSTVLSIRGQHNYRNVILEQFKDKLSPLPAKNVKFDWVPPNISNELAAEYMEKLPPRKLPATGSIGAKYRQQQIEKQIPLHDISFETSNKLGHEGQKRFFEYLQNVRENVVGQAKIQKLCLRFADKTENVKEPFSDAREETAVGPSLRLPSAFFPVKTNKKMPLYPSVTNANLVSFPCASLTDDVKVENINSNLASDNSTDTVKSDSDLPAGDVKGEESIINDNVREDLLLNNLPKNPLTSSVVDNTLLNVNTLDSFKTEDTTPTNPISSSLVDNELMNIIQPGPVKSDNTTDPSNNKESIEKKSIDEMLNNVTLNNYDFKSLAGFDSHPSGYKPSPINDQDDASSQSQASVVHPEPTRTHLAQQNHLLPVNSALRCAQCRKEIPLGSVAVVTDRTGKDVAWHPQCFVCNVCQELLVDLIYFYCERKVFCGRHYAEKMNIPRCYACDELIFVKEYTMAEGKSYHVNHYCCTDCDTELAGKGYLIHNEQIKCLDCYNTNYTKTCSACELKILATDKGIHVGDVHWHESPNCFKCFICGIYLLGKKISIKKGGHLLCSTKCIEVMSALK